MANKLPISEAGKQELQNYVSSAIKTESQIENVEVNEELLLAALNLYIQSGQMLDQIKKHVFYKKPYNIDNLINNWEAAHVCLKQIHDANVEEEKTVSVNPRIFHSVVGIATESTELCEALYDNLENKNPLDLVNLHEEAGGDISWYTAILMDETQGNWGDDLNKNILKLMARYSDKFSTENAINRDLVKERAILEGKA